MAEYVQEEFSYVDGGRVVRKRTWYDPDSGYSWDTFDDEGPAPDANAATGSVVDAGTLANAGNVPTRDFNPGVPASGDQTGWTNPEGSVIPEQTPGVAAGTVGAAAGAATSRIAAPAGSQPAAGAGGGTVTRNPMNPWATPEGGGGGGGGVDPGLQTSGRNMFLFNPDQPSTAMGNVLRGMGFNPGFNNPFTNYLQRFAPGLGAAFGINTALGPGATREDLGGDFASYIRRALSGGGIGGILDQARGQLPDAITAIRNQVAANPMEPNPYLANLQNILEQGGGQGLAGVISSLMSPLLTPRMAQANQQQILSSLGARQYNYGTSDAFTDPSQYWLQQLFAQR